VSNRGGVLAIAMALVGLEPKRLSTANIEYLREFAETSAAESGAVAANDPDFKVVASRWSRLPKSTREGLAAFVITTVPN
jgi:hypothetical protein